MNAVDKFLARKDIPKSGCPCRTCQLPNRKAVEADAQVFNERRKAGATRISWPVFVNMHMRPEHDYQLNFRSLTRHLEKCLGIEVH